MLRQVQSDLQKIQGLRRNPSTGFMLLMNSNRLINSHSKLKMIIIQTLIDVWLKSSFAVGFKLENEKNSPQQTFSLKDLFSATRHHGVRMQIAKKNLKWVENDSSVPKRATSTWLQFTSGSKTHLAQYSLGVFITPWEPVCRTRLQRYANQSNVTVPKTRTQSFYLHGSVSG